MKDLIKRAVDQLDKLDDRLDNVDKTLVRQEENLREHMRRTELLEDQLSTHQYHVDHELEPIKTHVSQVRVVIKFIIAVSGIVAAIVGALKIL